jgi:two-component sensor histidine kinase
MAKGGASYSLSFRLILIAMVSVLPVLGVTAYDALELRRKARAESIRAVGNSLDALYSQQMLLMENTRLLLSALSRTQIARNPDPEALHELFRGLHEDNPLYLALLAFDPSGEMIAANSESPSVNIADRSYFSEVKRRKAFTVGDYAISRTTGRETIHFAYPVYSATAAGSAMAEGSLSCVLVAAYDLDYYGKLFGVETLNSGSVVEVFDRSGVRLFRFPANGSEAVGEPGGDAVMRLVKGGSVNSMRLSTRDFPGQIAASRFVILDESAYPDFFMLIRSPEGIALADADAITNRSILMILFSLAISFLLLRVLTYFGVGAQLKRLVASARRIGAGDYSLPGPAHGGNAERGGSAELDVLGSSLDEMALRLAGRERERDEAEAALRASLAEKEILLKEIHHRVKNNFQIVSSLLNLQAGTMSDPEAIEAFAASQNRIKSMALIHEKLYQSESLERIDFADYLRSMTEEIASAFSAVANRVKLELELERVELSIDSAIPLGLILNEILTNSYKYAFADGRPGRILVRLACVEIDGARRVRIEAEDDGIGLEAAAAGKAGLGRELIKGLAEQLRAELFVDGSRGTRYRLEFSRGG